MSFDGKLKEELKGIVKFCDDAKAAAEELKAIISNLEDAPEDLSESGYSHALIIHLTGTSIIERFGRIDGMYAAAFELKHGLKKS